MPNCSFRVGSQVRQFRELRNQMRAYACLASQERIRENEALRVAGHLRCRRLAPLLRPSDCLGCRFRSLEALSSGGWLGCMEGAQGERRYALGSNQHYQLSLLWG